MENTRLKKLIFSAIFLALGFILPIFFGQLPTIGQMLVPMHIPVILCGMVCDWKHGTIIGFILPLLRSLIFSVPVLYPTAISVAFEMATYGLIVGILYGYSKKKSIFTIYFAMIVTMILGRIIRCISQILLLNIQGNPFVWKSFFTGVILNSIPGVILQLIIIPIVIIALKRAKLLEFNK